MTEQEKNVIIMNGFYDELEKNAQMLPTIFKAMKAVGGFAAKHFGSSGKLLRYAETGLAEYGKGGEAGLNALRDFTKAFKHPEYLKGGKDFLKNDSTFLANRGKFVKNNNGWLQSQMGEKVHMIGEMKKGFKSTGKVLMQEMRNTQYKTVDPTVKTWFGKGPKPELVWKNDKAYLKGQGIMRDRLIKNAPVNTGEAGTREWFNAGNKAIAHKRLGSRALALSVATLPMMAMPFVFGGVNKDSIQESAKDGATNMIPGGWEARMAGDLVGALKKKKNEEQ